MKLKAIIAEGTMAPKAVYDGEFINPITQETKTCEITVTLCESDVQRIVENKEDCLPIFDECAQKEYDDSLARYQYGVIKEYAKEHNYEEISCDLRNSIWKHIQDVATTAESSKVIIDVRLIHELHDDLEAIKTDDEIFSAYEKTCAFYYFCSVEIDKKVIRIFANSIALWSEQNCLVYDEKNPKNCKMISFI